MVRNTFEVQNIGDLLREKRRQLGKDIREVSEHTKIRSEYLLALESGNYDKFASDVYAKGFLKKYAKYLGISPERAAAMYRREISPERDNSIHNTNYLSRRLVNRSFEFTPGRLITAGIVVAIVLFVGYLVSQVSVVLKAPELKIMEPVAADAQNDNTFSTTLDKVTIRGQADIGSIVSFNGNRLNLNNLQSFEVKDQPLVIGQNRFTLSARSQFGQESDLVLTVIRNPIGVTPPTAGTTTPGSGQVAGVNNGLPASSPTSELNAKVTIGDKAAFVRIKLDGDNTFAGELGAGATREFKARKTFVISTNHPEEVGLTLNGQTFTLATVKEYTFDLAADGRIVMKSL